MPFCNLTETAVLEQLKNTFNENKDLRQRKDLRYFYKQLVMMNQTNIARICDKVVKFGKVDFEVRMIGRKNNNDPKKPTVIEELQYFSVYACNDTLFAYVNADRYFYSSSIGNETFSEDAAKKLGEEAAKKLYEASLAERGYTYESCVIEAWEYVGKGTEKYTEYTFRYDRNQKIETNIKAVGMGDHITICNEPNRTPKGEKWYYSLLGVAAAAAIAGIVIAVLFL